MTDDIGKIDMLNQQKKSFRFYFKSFFSMCDS